MQDPNASKQTIWFPLRVCGGSRLFGFTLYFLQQCVCRFLFPHTPCYDNESAVILICVASRQCQQLIAVPYINRISNHVSAFYIVYILIEFCFCVQFLHVPIEEIGSCIITAGDDQTKYDISIIFIIGTKCNKGAGLIKLDILPITSQGTKHGIVCHVVSV